MRQKEEMRLLNLNLNLEKRGDDMLFVLFLGSLISGICGIWVGTFFQQKKNARQAARQSSIQQKFYADIVTEGKKINKSVQ